MTLGETVDLAARKFPDRQAIVDIDQVNDILIKLHYVKVWFQDNLDLVVFTISRFSNVISPDFFYAYFILF